MKKIFLPGLVAGVVMVIIGLALNSLWQVVFPGLKVEFETPLYRPWSDPLMSLVFVCPLLTGFFFAWVWNMMKAGYQAPTAKKVFLFASGFTIFSIIGMLMMYSCFPMSFLMLVTWIVSTAVEYYVGTWILAKMNA
jgi:hypothetical protein